MSDSPSPERVLRLEAGARLVLFGGGRLLADAASRARGRGLDVVAVCGPAHLAEEVYPETSLAAHLATWKVPVHEHSRLRAADVAPLVDQHTVGLSLSAPWIFRQDVIDLFGGRLLNLHGTDLPHNRGGGGFTWQILRGDRRGGLSLHILTAAVDEGDVALQLTFSYPETCAVPADFAAYRLVREHAFLDTFLDSVLVGEALPLAPQDESVAVYWPRISTAVHGFVDWSWTAEEIARFAAAFGAPHAGAGTFLRDREVRLSDCSTWGDDGAFHPFQSGLVYRRHDGRLFVACGGVALVVGRVTDAEGVDITSTIRAGARFHTPSDVLDRARRARFVVGPEGTKIVE